MKWSAFASPPNCSPPILSLRLIWRTSQSKVAAYIARARPWHLRRLRRRVRVLDPLGARLRHLDRQPAPHVLGVDLDERAQRREDVEVDDGGGLGVAKVDLAEEEQRAHYLEEVVVQRLRQPDVDERLLAQRQLGAVVPPGDTRQPVRPRYARSAAGGSFSSEAPYGAPHSMYPMW